MPEGSASSKSPPCAKLGWLLLGAPTFADSPRRSPTMWVVVHGDGRCIRGKDEFEADFLKAFESLRIEQRVVDPDVVIRGDWAFEIGRVESILTPIRGGTTRCAVTTTLVALRKQLDGTWKVARVVGLLD